MSLRTVIDWLFPEPVGKGLVVLDDRPARGVAFDDPGRDYSLGPDFDDGPPVRHTNHRCSPVPSLLVEHPDSMSWEGLAGRFARHGGSSLGRPVQLTAGSRVERLPGTRWHGPDDVL